jgi:hypothetical protein
MGVDSISNNTQPDSRSLLERRFDQNFISDDPQLLVQLIKILQMERNSWRDNSKALEKVRIASEKLLVAKQEQITQLMDDKEKLHEQIAKLQSEEISANR